MKISSILGLNARFQLYSSQHNTRRGKKIAGSKLITKRILEKNKIAIPQIYAKIKNLEDIEKFKWNTLPKSFAFKPSRGLGGQGIIVVKKKTSDGKGWITTQRKVVTVDDLKLHASDILEGAYSLGNVPDMAFIEEFVGRHKAFRKYAYRGTPDIRVIVFNRIPVMAMLRFPTKESGGRANLHQGALGVGVDIATGITTYAVWHGEPIRYKPDTKRKLHGIRIPYWNRVLELAVRCQEVSGLGYLGVDIVLHPENGPMVLELNSEPGLDIQIANMSGLRRRLERIEDLKVLDADHGVKIAKAIFASSFATRVKTEEEGIKRVKVFEKVKIRGTNKKLHSVEAKVDTGAWRTSIDKSLATELGLLVPDNIIMKRRIKSSMGQETRPIIALTYILAGRKIRTSASVTNRGKLRKKVIIGRKDLSGFSVDLSKNA